MTRRKLWRGPWHRLLAGALVLAIGPIASAQTKKEVPLDTKGDASARPWKRYAGWPTRDKSKYNTLGNLATPPAPKQPRKITLRSPATRKKAPSWSQTVIAAVRVLPAM